MFLPNAVDGNQKMTQFSKEYLSPKTLLLILASDNFSAVQQSLLHSGTQSHENRFLYFSHLLNRI
jgi:hypothetical protein